jgi:hypothetical protein
MITPGATGRRLAIIPPIWCNIRRIPTALTLHHDPSVQKLWLLRGAKAFVMDGWHRCLAIRRAVRAGQLAQRSFTFYFFDAPLELEARAFRILNTSGLPVERNRVAWVSAPFANDFYRVAYEFVAATPSLMDGSDLNIEVVKSNVNRNSAVLCSFLAIANGFTTPFDGKTQIWGSLIHPHNAVHRRLVVEYMSAYWSFLVKAHPFLDFRSTKERLQTREDYYLLVNNVAVQCLIWLGHALLVAYRPQGNDQSDLAKLQELQNPAIREKLFEQLAPLRNPAFWALSNPVFAHLLNDREKLSRNDYKSRKQFYDVLVTAIGSPKPHTVATLQRSIRPRTPKGGL